MRWLTRLLYPRYVLCIKIHVYLYSSWHPKLYFLQRNYYLHVRVQKMVGLIFVILYYHWRSEENYKSLLSSNHGCGWCSERIDTMLTIDIGCWYINFLYRSNIIQILHCAIMLSHLWMKHWWPMSILHTVSCIDGTERLNNSLLYCTIFLLEIYFLIESQFRISKIVIIYH